jgi:hypothetical protein
LVDPAAHRALHGAKSSPRKKANVDFYAAATKGRAETGSPVDLESVLTSPAAKRPSKHPQEGLDLTASPESAADESFEDHLYPELTPSPEKGGSGAEGGGGGGGGGGRNAILQAVQQQRDRFMRAVREKERELAELRGESERLQDEMTQLKNENLEIYRRLRILRVNTSSSSSSSSGKGGHEEDSHLHLHRGRERRQRLIHPLEEEEESMREARGSSAAGSDPLERKYLSLYEEKLSPFQLEQLDKQVFLSRLNPFERVLAFTVRNAMQDKWSRNALMVYLLLVHVLALFYVLQVLNPQLIDEVDAHLKAKWSKEAMSLPEHPDIEG